MSERKLYQVFKGLAEAEIKVFESYLREDKRSSGKRMWKFYAALRKNVMGLELETEEVKEGEMAVAKLLKEGNEDLNLAFRRWCNKLLEKLHRFLVEKEIEAFPEGFKGLLLLKAYERRALQIPFTALFKGFERKMQDMLFGDLYYELKFRASQLAIEIDSPGGSHTKESFHNIGDYFTNLDNKYLYHLARVNAFTLHFNKVSGAEWELRHQEIMWELSRFIDRTAHPAIDIFLTFIELLSEETTPESIRNFDRKYRELYDKLEPTERYVMFGYCVSQIQTLLNKGLDSLRPVLLEMHQFGIANELLFSGGKIDWLSYKGMIQLALMEGKTELAQNYINELAQDKVWYDYEGQREVLGQFMQIKINLARKEYKKALSDLNYLSVHMKLNDLNLEIDFRTMKLQLHYLLKQWEPGFSALDAFRMYVSNNSDLISKNSMVVLHWRLRWFRRLYRFGQPNSAPKQGENLLKELEADPRYRLKDWFREELIKII
jgi:hypothetical protein